MIIGNVGNENKGRLRINHEVKGGGAAGVAGEVTSGHIPVVGAVEEIVGGNEADNLGFNARSVIIGGTAPIMRDAKISGDSIEVEGVDHSITIGIRTLTPHKLGSCITS